MSQVCRFNDLCKENYSTEQLINDISSGKVTPNNTHILFSRIVKQAIIFSIYQSFNQVTGMLKLKRIYLGQADAIIRINVNKIYYCTLAVYNENYERYGCPNHPNSIIGNEKDEDEKDEEEDDYLPAGGKRRKTQKRSRKNRKRSKKQRRSRKNKKSSGRQRKSRQK